MSGCNSCLLDVPNTNTNSTGETSVAACMCAEGFYTLKTKERNVGRQCEPCTDGMMCGVVGSEVR